MKEKTQDRENSIRRKQIMRIKKCDSKRRKDRRHGKSERDSERKQKENVRMNEESRRFYLIWLSLYTETSVIPVKLPL